MTHRHRLETLRAHRQAATVLAATLELPQPRVRRRTSSPTVAEAELAGQPATIIRPAVAPPWPSFVFANGATPDGRAHPVVLRLGVALAKTGYGVYIPDLPGIADGVLTPLTVTAAVNCTSHVVELEETRGGRVGLVGVSIGGTLALLVAADARLAPRISVVACIAPFTDLERVIHLATTGTYRDASGAVNPYEVPLELAAGLARSIDQLASGESQAPIRELLDNRDPGRFERLYQELPATVRDAVVELSPRLVADRILAPVEIATAPRDRYFPLGESLALAANPGVRVTVTPTLSHALPRLDPRNVSGLVRLERFFVRTLLAASRGTEEGGSSLQGRGETSRSARAPRWDRTQNASRHRGG